MISGVYEGPIFLDKRRLVICVSASGEATGNRNPLSNWLGAGIPPREMGCHLCVVFVISKFWAYLVSREDIPKPRLVRISAREKERR
jgi:hypothetical protein